MARVTEPRISPIAVSLASATTADCLRDLERLPPEVGMAEIRLDLMRAFDVPQLVKESPLPLIVTCRAQREGGRFEGGERERLAILRTAYDSGCAFIDVEADTLDVVAGWPGSPTRVIGSRHWYDRMPAALPALYADLRDRCDVVKLTGMATSAWDVLLMLELLRDATTPVIGIAMGELGVCSRILAPVFPRVLLTYGSTAANAGTAPGQITVDQMANIYGLHLVDASTRVFVHVVRDDAQLRAAEAAQVSAAPGRELHVALRAADAGDAARLEAAVAGLDDDLVAIQPAHRGLS